MTVTVAYSFLLTDQYIDGNVALNNCEYCSYHFPTHLSDDDSDLQGKGRLSALSWLDESTGAQDAPVWKSTCKSEFGRSIVARFILIPTILSVAGNVIAVGTGSHKHIARNDAATKALKVLEEQDNNN